MPFTQCEMADLLVWRSPVLGGDAPHVSGEGLVVQPAASMASRRRELGSLCAATIASALGAVNRVYRFNCVPPYPLSVTIGSHYK
ncbi:hypothetical protein GCM10023238_05010 [Streptomyces heliomycini]